MATAQIYLLNGGKKNPAVDVDSNVDSGGLHTHTHTCKQAWQLSVSQKCAFGEEIELNLRKIPS